MTLGKKLIYLKALLFLVIILAAASLILMESPTAKTLVLLALVIWASARLYYFMFYVIENYVDSGFKFSGIYAFVRYLLEKK